jgi:hypothetical protein
MRTWGRWQDWLVAIGGLVLALTPLWFETGSTRADTAMVIVGAALALASVWSLLMPKMQLSEWVHVAVGVMAFVAPWVFDYVDVRGAAWTSWIVGVAAVVLGLWVVPVTGRVLHRIPVHR